MRAVSVEDVAPGGQARREHPAELRMLEQGDEDVCLLDVGVTCLSSGGEGRIGQIPMDVTHIVP